MLHDLYFLRPFLLGALFVVLPAVGALWYANFRLRLKARAAYGEERLVSRFSKPLRIATEALAAVCLIVATALLVVAAAGPVLPDAPQRVQAGSLQVVFVTDVSVSMAAEPYRAQMPPKNGVPAVQVPGPYGTCLDEVKLTILGEMFPALVGNKVGIVTYQGEGFMQAPLTDDFESLRWILTTPGWMEIGGAPGSGSDYAEGLTKALELFKKANDPKLQKVLVIFSDGGFTGEEDAKAKVIQQIRDAGIRVIVVGVGPDAPMPIPVYTADGQPGFPPYYQLDDQTATTKIDEGALSTLAASMGGTYVRLTPGKNLNVQWASTLAGSKTEQHVTPMYQYPLGAAMFLLFALLIRGVLPARRKA